MAFDRSKHHRRSIRLKGYDYRQAGLYFVTICVQGGRNLLGDVVEGKMVIDDLGRIVEEEWLRMAELRANVELDTYVVMPNHFHGIVWITSTGLINQTRTLINQTPTDGDPVVEREYGKPLAGSLGSIIGVYKAAVTRRVNLLSDTPTGSFWQRNYYEHIIRNEQSLDTIRQYVENNPASWKQDKFFSAGRERWRG